MEVRHGLLELVRHLMVLSLDNLGVGLDLFEQKRHVLVQVVIKKLESLLAYLRLFSYLVFKMACLRMYLVHKGCSNFISMLYLLVDEEEDLLLVGVDLQLAFFYHFGEVGFLFGHV